jgi:hypothetical protein
MTDTFSRPTGNPISLDSMIATYPDSAGMAGVGALTD